jgi:gamma-glutamyl phosphate reductase
MVWVEFSELSDKIVRVVWMVDSAWQYMRQHYRHCTERLIQSTRSTNSRFVQSIWNVQMLKHGLGRVS